MNKKSSNFNSFQYQFWSPVYNGPLMDSPLSFYTFMLHHFHVALFPFCNLFVFYFFHDALSSWCTLFMLHFFCVVLSSCCTFFMLHSMLHFFTFHVFFVFHFSHSLHVAFIFHFFHVSLFLLFISHFILCSSFFVWSFLVCSTKKAQHGNSKTWKTCNTEKAHNEKNAILMHVNLNLPKETFSQYLAEDLITLLTINGLSFSALIYLFPIIEKRKKKNALPGVKLSKIIKIQL